MRNVPLLWPSIATPKNEIMPIKDLHAHLHGLVFSVHAWEAALRLYQMSNRPPPAISSRVAESWRWIACHECVLELYHLRARLEKTTSVRLKACPSVRHMIQIDKTKKARKELEETFPNIEDLRHAVAHRGENEAHTELHDPDGFGLAGFRETDRFSIHHKGKLTCLDITDASLVRITAVVDEFLSAFEPAAVLLEQQGHLE